MQTMSLITELKALAIAQKRPLWKRVAVELESPTRRKREVNVFKLDAAAKEGETVIVPGKVLGSGVLSKNITVAALSFSESAKQKIAAKGKVITIEEAMKQNPQGTKVRIMG